MGRGGGGSSGGRSSGGGGGSRSSGGFRGGGSSSHRGGYGSSSSRSSSYSSPGRTGYGIGYGRGTYTGGYYDRRPYYGNRTVVYTGTSGIILNLITGIILILMVSLLFFGLNFSKSNITKSTIEREPLDKSYVTTTNYYEDHAGWIASSSKLEAGMKHFYDKTGVQPYLYITETINGNGNPSDTEMEEFANSLYDELFTDEGHLLVVFQEYNSSGNYFCWMVAGKQAKVVFDNEARGILADYIDSNYYSDLSEEEFFSNAFYKAADRMMEVTKSPWPIVILVIVILAVVLVAFNWWKKAKAQKNLEAEQTERILNADIGDISNPEISDLEEKYNE